MTRASSRYAAARRLPPADLAEVLELRRRAVDAALARARGQEQSAPPPPPEPEPDNEHDPWGVW